MLTISWDFGRKVWHGMEMFIQPEWKDDLECTVWAGKISDSYYVFRSPVPGDKPDPMFLRIRCAEGSVKSSSLCRGVPISQAVWEPRLKIPRIVVSARMTELYVTEGKNGGDLWCFFSIPEEYQRPGGPYCRQGWLVIRTGAISNRISSYALRLKEQRMRIF